MTTTVAAGERAVERSAARPGPGDRPGGDDPTARPHAEIGPAVRAGGPDPALRRRLLVPEDAAVPDLRDPRAGQPRLGPGRQRVSRLPLRLRRHGGGARASADRRGRSTRRPAAAPTSRSPPSPRWRSARRSAGGSTSRCCASPTRAPRPPWMPSGWPGRRPAGTSSARSRARITGTTTRDVLDDSQRRPHGRPRPARRARRCPREW